MSKNFIAIGGCHIKGYGLMGKPSFVEYIESNLNLCCTFKRDLFQLKQIDKIEPLIAENSNDFVLLQLGNLEYFIQFRPKYFRQKLNDDVYEDKDKSEALLNQNIFLKNLKFLIQLLLIPFIQYYVKHKNGKYLLQLQKVILNNLDKTFVIVSPLPTYSRAHNMIRRRAGDYFKNYLDLENVVFINSFDHFPIIKDMFCDVVHLSSKGHFYLAKKIINRINESFKIAG